MSDVAESAEKVFRLSDEIRQLLYDFAARRETERAEHFDFSLVVPQPPAMPSAQADPGAYITQAVLPASRSRMVDGRYELGDFLEEGGLGSFYKGRDQITGRPVVVKLLRPAQVADPVALSRFRREAQIARKLDHDQVIKTYDFVDGPADFAIILERLTGPTLEELVRDEGRMPPAEVVGMGQVLADALAYLADQRVVRLDLKPGNIIMADRGPVIADLGIAFQEDEPGERDELIDRITVTGAFIGTPAYLPPEVIDGRKADHRADIYALGLVMYYCLGGQTPWHDAKNFPAIAYRVLQERVDLSGLGISEGFRAVLAKAIAKNPDERFSNADALSDGLRQTPEWLSLRGEPSVRIRPTGRYHVVGPDRNPVDVPGPRPGDVPGPPPVGVPGPRPVNTTGTYTLNASRRYNLNATRQDREVVFVSAMIVGWVSDEPSPGLVEVRLSDGEGRTWSFVDKYPVFYRAGTLSRVNQTYPVRIEVACTVTGRSADRVTVSIALPWGIAATDGTSEFVMRESQIIYRA